MILLTFLSKSLSNKNLIIILWPSCTIFLLCCKFQITILKTVEVAETRTMLGHVYKVIFLVNQGYVTLTIIIQSEFYDLSTHAQSISLLWCKFQTLTLKTVGGVAETWTVLQSVTDGWMDGWMDTWTDRQTHTLPGKGIKTGSRSWWHAIATSSSC